MILSWKYRNYRVYLRNIELPQPSILLVWRWERGITETWGELHNFATRSRRETFSTGAACLFSSTHYAELVPLAEQSDALRDFGASALVRSS